MWQSLITNITLYRVLGTFKSLLKWYNNDTINGLIIVIDNHITIDNRWLIIPYIGKQSYQWYIGYGYGYNNTTLYR